MSSEEWRPFCLCLNIKFSTVTGWLQMLKISSIIFWQDVIAITGLYYELTRINEAQELNYMSYRELRRVNEIQGYANCSVCKDVWAYVNSQRSNDAYMRHRNMPSLVQIMLCRLFGAKPLSKPILAYHELDTCGKISVKYNSMCFRWLRVLKLSSDCTW